MFQSTTNNIMSTSLSQTINSGRSIGGAGGIAGRADHCCGWLLRLVAILWALTVSSNGHDEFSNHAAFRWGKSDGTFLIEATYEEVAQNAGRSVSSGSSKDGSASIGSFFEEMCAFSEMLARRFSILLDGKDLPLKLKSVRLPAPPSNGGRIDSHQTVVFEMAVVEWALPKNRAFDLEVRQYPSVGLGEVPAVYEFTIASAAGAVCTTGRFKTNTEARLGYPVDKKAAAECTAAEKSRATFVDD